MIQMSNKEVFDSRDEVNKTLVESLSRYGNLEPPGIVGRPYNDGSKSKYQFSAANYLRIMAVQRQKEYKDPRWISETFLEKHGLSVREDAVPVGIEYWKGIDQGKEYKGELKKFYNVAELLDNEVQPKLVQGDREEDFAYAVDLLKASGAHANYKYTAEQIFEATEKFARKKGADEFSAPLTAQILLKTSQLSYDYTKHPLFTQEQLERLDKNPKILFHAEKKAQQLMAGMLYQQEEQLKHMADRIRQEENLKKSLEEQKKISREPFKDLYVEYKWSEAILKDVSGKEYVNEQDPKNPDANLSLHGEKAYEFLVQLNAMDKEKFNGKLEGTGNYYKTKIAIRYGSYDHGEMRIDLGDLELRNKKAIAPALEERFGEYGQRLLKDPHERSIYLGVHKDEGITDEQLVEECKQSLAECHNEMKKFAQEEAAYLANHPELKAINERNADVNLYYCSARDLDQIPEELILSRHKAADFPGIARVEAYPGAYDNKAPVFKSPEADGIIIESAWMYSKENARKFPLQPAITRESQEILQSLDKISMKIEDYGPVMEPFSEAKVTELKGHQAVQYFISEKANDVSAAQTMLQQEEIYRQNPKKMTIVYEDKVLKEVAYEIGSGALNEAVPSGFPQDEDPKVNEAIHRAICVDMKYQGLYENRMHELVDTETIKLPDKETVKARLKEEKPSARSMNSKQYAYYETLALTDFQNNTQEKLMKSMVQEMRQDGLTNTKMMNIAKSNPKFNLALLEEDKKKETVKTKRKLQLVVSNDPNKEKSRSSGIDY